MRQIVLAMTAWIAGVCVFASPALGEFVTSVSVSDSGTGLTDGPPGSSFVLDYASLVDHNYREAELRTLMLAFDAAGARFERLKLLFEGMAEPATAPSAPNGSQVACLLYDPAYGVPGASEDITLLEMDSAVKEGFEDGVLTGRLWVAEASLGPVTLWHLGGSAEFALAMPGDANGDGMVDLMDLDILGRHLGMTGMTRGDGDLNDDGDVDIVDLGILGQHYGEHWGSRVPEPATLGLLAAGGSILVVGHRKKLQMHITSGRDRLREAAMWRRG